MKKVSVIIPNMDGKHFLEKCLGSLAGVSFDDTEIIIVDNASKDGSQQWIKEEHPEVRLIENNENKGFAPAVNQGICLAEGKYVLLLNNDTEVLPGFIEALCKPLDEDEKVFGASAQMLMYSDHDLIDDAGDLYTVFGLAFQRGNRKPVSKCSKTVSITAPCGGACLYRKSVLSEIGLLDDAFFAYREDLDLGIRAKLAGYKNVYAPEAKVIHYGSGTANKSGKRYNEFKTRLGTRNLVWLNYKNFPLLLHLINLPFLLFGVIVKSLFFLRHGLTGAYLKAIFEGIANLKKVKHVPFKLKKLKNYLAFEAELFMNCFRIF
ncbi:MAG: glycosyltransferase family 2 protein [Lachnospiraceae bacterium]|nr:glycosyltransferase family 2 protein [Lachnospiraceae bacterium]